MANEFVHIGMGAVVPKGRVILITPPGSTTATRLLDAAKKSNKYHNATLGKTHRSLIIMDEGYIIMSTISPKTLMRRLNGIDPPAGDDDPDEEITEDEMPDGDDE